MEIQNLLLEQNFKGEQPEMKKDKDMPQQIMKNLPIPIILNTNFITIDAADYKIKAIVELEDIVLIISMHDSIKFLINS